MYITLPDLFRSSDCRHPPDKQETPSGRQPEFAGRWAPGAEPHLGHRGSGIISFLQNCRTPLSLE